MKNKLFLSALSLVVGGTLLAQSAPSAAAKKECYPVASVANHTGTSNITKAELEKFSEISVKNDCDKETYTVVSFEFTAALDNSDKKPAIFMGTSPVLSSEMKTALTKLKPGSKVFLDNFKAKKADGTIKSISGITLKVQ